MKNFAVLFVFICTTIHLQAQTQSMPARPKLVVGIVVDQMRWDYLYRYFDLYANGGGFKRLLNEGFTCENTMIPYTPTVTAAGHTCIYTGSVPAIHGIVGNEWYDFLQHKVLYCCEDSTVTTLGATDDNGKMSPRNMFATTVTDELRLATNFASKTIGISMKDRGAILPAGHAANAAYWYDANIGSFISSTYYMKALPAWVDAFNSRKIADSLYKLNWNLSLPEAAYAKYATPDDEPYERKPFGADQTHFPYNISKFAGKDYGKILTTPYGNEILLNMAKATIAAEQMGKHDATDFLAVSFSSPDYIGHTFGPNSVEQADDYIKLDKQIGELLAYLDQYVGKGDYTVFLSADHGAAHVPKFSIEHNLPGGYYSSSELTQNINLAIKEKTGLEKIVSGIEEYQLIINKKIIDSAGADENTINKIIVDYLETQPFVAQAFAVKDLNATNLADKQKEMFGNSFFPNRSGQIQMVLKPGYLDGDGNGTSHGLWNPYDAHIPLVWYGWGIQHGKTNRETYMTDIAPTISALLHIQMPSGSVGKVIPEVMK